tara:strand:+ start:391 stop:702 length:312 start_codon:yes stop_codon:yes gene_type:complete
MEFKGTKGKWWACCTGEGKKSHFVFAVNSEQVICAMSSNDPNDEYGNYTNLEEITTLSQRQANAKLIAAAPELLEFAIEMVRRYPNSPWIAEQGTEAIKKATE